MAALGARCANAGALLHLGQVLAWRAGLPHFRTGALEAADRLPAPLALAAIGARPEADWAVLRARLRDDPWFDPRSGIEAPAPRPSIVARAGAFRGFGGLFLAPPLVQALDGRLLVASGDDRWLLEADIFGVSFHRATEEEAGRFVPPGIEPPDRLLLRTVAALDLASLGHVTSAAQAGGTLALTGSLTHAVMLVAVPLA
jgi:hypothetical protein